MKRWPMILVAVGFLAAAAVLAYAGFHTLALRHEGTPATATIIDCNGTVGRGATASCHGQWIVEGRSVMGLVEGATPEDLSRQLPVIVSGERAWIKRTAEGVGGTALFFSALCLALAILLALSLRDPK